ncbi:MAG: hypothetical protein ABSG43_29005 [Solirubrobacteraceae bacterium]
MRLLALEQRVRDDLARWYGPVASRRYELALRAVTAWLADLRAVLASRSASRHWRRCEQERPYSPLAGCWRTAFSPQDAPSRHGTPRIAAGAREGRIVVDVIGHDGATAIRVLAIGPKHAGKGLGRQEWVYMQAERRRRHAYASERGG